MTVIEFMAELRRLGVGLRLERGQITVQAPTGVLTPQLRSQLQQHRNQLIAVLAGARDGDAAPLQPISRDGPIPASYAQQRLWFLDRLRPGGSQYNVPIAIRLGGPVNEAALRCALDGLVARHEPLRTTFNAPDGVPLQVIHSPGPAPWQLSDVSADGEPLSRAASLIAADAAVPFDLERGPLLRSRLIRLGPNDRVLVLLMHHIVSDEWSAGVIQQDLAALYAAAKAGAQSPASLTPLTVQYADYATWQRHNLEGQRREPLLAHWQEALRGLVPTQLPTDRQRTDVPSEQGAVAEFSIPAEVTAGVRQLGRRYGTTVFMTLLAAFNVLLARYTGRTDIAVGTPVAGRDRADLEPLVGFFVNTLVLRTYLTGNPPFAEVLRRTRSTALNAYAHQELPFEVLVEHLAPERARAGQPMFSIMFRLEHQREPLTLSSVDACELPVAQRTAKFELSVAITESPDGLWGGAEYATGLFDPSTIEMLLRSYVALLDAAVHAPDTPINALPLLDPDLEAYLRGVSAGPTPQLPYRTVPDQIRQRASERPDAVAVIAGDCELTYQALINRANELAARLRRAGAGPETVIAVCLPRTADLVTGLLATLLAGAAYLPLDPAQPPARLGRLVSDAGPLLVMVDPSTAAPFNDLGTPLLDVTSAEPDTASRTPAPPAIHPAQPAYVVYTSGSTGAPKAVVVSHQALSGLIAAFNQEAPVAPGQALLAVTTVSFDIAALELWLPLTVGAAVILAADADTRDPRASTRLLDQPEVQVVQATPAWWRMVLDAGWPGRSDLTVWCGGEALPGTLARRLRAATADVHNLYGPTETTIWSTQHSVAIDDESGITPIGRPLAGTTCHVVDESGRLIPPGAVGELLIGGVGVSRGYRGRPDLTAERFIADPFAGDGTRLYRTGDRVRRRSDGVLQFVGRLDDQLKIRGHRVEPAEVEAVLNQHNLLTAAAVTGRAGPDGEVRLVAYVVPRDVPRDEQAAEHGDDHTAVHLDRWRRVWDTAVDAAPADPAFDITGWVASDSGEPIPAEQMREWVDTTVARLRRLRARRILELGCGTGLLLWRLAPHCDEYTATDFAAAPLDALARRLPADLASRARLLCRESTDLDGLTPGTYDLVVLNSVAQYFPDVAHLHRVVHGALAMLRPGGHVFVGDLRSLPLLPLQRGRDSADDERELLLDPRLFHALRHELPQVQHVQVMPRSGRHHNELTAFRYDAILHTAPPRLIAPTRWRHWIEEGLTLDRLEHMLSQEEVAVVGFTNVRNARLAGPTGSQAGAPVEPDDLHQIGQRHGWSTELSWAAARADGSFDAVFHRNADATLDGDATLAEFPTPAAEPHAVLANDPLTASRRFAERTELATAVRALAVECLPDYLVPSLIRIVDTLPLTANGKIDRRALPDPSDAPIAGGDPPATATERAIADIWCEVLGTPGLGRDETFFALGGHSLLATQVVSRIGARLGVDVSLQQFFADPTVRALALLVDNAPPTAQSPRIEATTREEPLPLSFAQQRVWFLAQLRPDSPEYNLTIATRLRGELDVSRLRLALTSLVRRHEILRTTFPAVEGVPSQHVHDASIFDLPVMEVTDDQAEDLVAAAATEPFDLATGPLLRGRLLRLHATAHILVLSCHHVICDDWSVQIIARNLTAAYEHLVDGHTADALPPLAVQYADFAVWQRRLLTADRLDRQLAYWRRQLSNLPHLHLPTDREYPPVRDPAADWVEIDIAAGVRERLARHAQDSHATMFMLILAAFACLLHRETGADDIPIGTPISGRAHPDLEQLVGLFVNTLVLRVGLTAMEPFDALLERVRDVTLDAYANQDVPFEQLVEHLGVHRDLSRHPLFQVLLNYTVDDTADAPALQEEETDERLARLEADNFGGPAPTGKFDLRLVVHDRPAGLRLTVQYRMDLFEHETVTRMLTRLQLILESVAENPRRPIGRLPLLTPAERQALSQWETGPTGPIGALLPARFQEHVRGAPDRPAAMDTQQTLTYQELDQAVTRLAASLVEIGVGADTVVGLVVSPTVELVVAVLAVWRAGGAYAAIDPVDPPPRIVAQLRAAQITVVVAGEAMLDAVPDLPVVVVPVYPPDPPNVDAFPPPHPDHLAYAVLTSGSTGTPKVVAVTHRGLANYTAAIITRIQPRANASWALAQPLSVDLGLTGLCAALGAGGCLHVIRPAHLIEDLAACRPDYLKLAPAHLRLLLDQPEPSQLLPHQGLILGGEATSPALLAALRRTNWQGQMFGHYGPAETTIGATVTTPDADSRLLLGTPLDNVVCHVLDPAGQPVPIGVHGELHLAGPGLARGYLGRPELTADRFVANPFANDGSRLYRTGDRVRRRPDGRLEFIGRVDDQLNVNGFRIEPGEVCAALTAHPQVAAAAVDARTDAAGQAHLVAWLVPGVPDGIRQWLTERVPHHLVPAEWVGVPALPLTTGGKLDRCRLPAPAERQPLHGDQPPSTATEWTLAALWGQTLGVDTVNRDDDFFDLGGHSLLATQVLARIPALFGIDLPLTALFDHPTLAALATQIDAAQAAPRTAPSAASPLIVLNRRPERPRLFCVHPLSGSTFCFRPIAAGLGDHAEFIGLQARGLLDDAAPFERVDDMAAYYETAIRQLQPEGPYRIAGWSFGSMVALEIAQRLVVAGHRVDFLGLIGPTNVERQHGTPLVAAKDVRRLRRLTDALVAGGARDREDLALAVYPLVCEPEFSGNPSTYDRELLFRRLRVLAAHRGAAARYRPRPYDGSCLLVMPETRHDDDPAVLRQWHRVARGGISVASAPGDHLSMVMDPANARHIARLLRTALIDGS